MKVNKNKCQIMHLRWNNVGHKCKLGEDWLESSPEEMDLRVLVDSKLHTSQQCALAAKKPSRILRCMKQSISSWSKEVVILLYLMLVQHQL